MQLTAAWRKSLLACALALCASASSPALAKGFVVENGQLVVTSSTGIETRRESFSSPNPVDPVTLSARDTLKLTFNVKDETLPSDSKVYVPHQSFLSFIDQDSGLDHIERFNVKPGTGKAKYELDLARLPPPLAFSTGKLTLSLQFGHFSHPSYASVPDPLNYNLTTLHIDPSILRFPPPNKAADEMGFEVQEGIEHQFNPPQRLPPMWKSVAGSLLVIAPWLVLLGSWALLAPSLRAPNARTVPFLLSLLSLEWLAYKFWTTLTLFQVLPWFFGLSVVTFFTGREALGQMRGWRVKGE